MPAASPLGTSLTSSPSGLSCRHRCTPPGSSTSSDFTTPPGLFCLRQFSISSSLKLSSSWPPSGLSATRVHVVLTCRPELSTANFSMHRSTSLWARSRQESSSPSGRPIASKRARSCAIFSTIAVCVAGRVSWMRSSCMDTSRSESSATPRP